MRDTDSTREILYTVRVTATAIILLLTCVSLLTAVVLNSIQSQLNELEEKAQCNEH